jgi:hypothetical protein
MINETPKFLIAQASRTTAHGPSRLETITLSFLWVLFALGLLFV